MKTKWLALLGLLVAVSTTACAQEETYPQLTGEVGAYKAGVYEIVERGMGGKITFHVTFSADAITGIEAVKHHETEGIGDRALESVIPQILEKQSTEVDAWAGATITSNAIINAVSGAMEEATVSAASYQAGDYEVTQRGMGGKMTFVVSFDDHSITGIEITKHHETEGIGDRAIENVIPRILEQQATDVEAWSGATITSNAIKAAVEEAMGMAEAK